LFTYQVQQSYGIEDDDDHGDDDGQGAFSDEGDDNSFSDFNDSNESCHKNSWTGDTTGKGLETETCFYSENFVHINRRKQWCRDEL
jgi:hypothetical protein